MASVQRSSLLPELPTVAETGLPGYEVSAWNAMFAPKGTPKDVVQKLSVALDKALSLFDGRTGAHEAIVLLTDGEDLEKRNMKRRYGVTLRFAPGAA